MEMPPPCSYSRTLKTETAECSTPSENIEKTKRLNSEEHRNTKPYVYLFVQMTMCAMLHSSIAHSIICTRLMREKMHSD
jgi:hypothetical protein